MLPANWPNSNPFFRKTLAKTEIEAMINAYCQTPTVRLACPISTKIFMIAETLAPFKVQASGLGGFVFH